MGFICCDLMQTIHINAYADFVAVKVASQVSGQPIEYWNSTIGSLRLCNDVAIGAKVYIIGFPSNNVLEDESTYRVFQATTKGIIIKTVYNQSPELPYPNYEHTAMNAAGDSGGVAFSEDSSGMCSLGIETWGKQPFGIVQNAHNALYSPSK